MSNVVLALERRQTGNNFQLDMDFFLRKLSCTYSVPRERMIPDISAYSSYSCSFRKDNVSSNTLALAAGKSLILTDSTASAEDKEWPAHDENISDLSWLPNEPKIVTTSSGKTFLWDVETRRKLLSYPAFITAHQCIDVCPDQGNILAVISGFGMVYMWDARKSAYPPLAICPNYYGILKCSTENSVFQPTPCVAFQNSRYLATANDHEPIIKIWDIRYIRNPILGRDQEPIRSVTYTEPTNNTSRGSISMTFNRAHNTLYVCCEDSNIYTLNGSSYCTGAVPFTGFVAGESLKKIALSYDDQYLLCGSMDKNAYIWHTKKPGKPVIKLVGHSGDVTTVDWHPRTITKLASCSNKDEVFIWDAARENEMENNVIGHAELYL